MMPSEIRNPFQPTGRGVQHGNQIRRTIVFRRDHATVCNDIVNDPAVVVWATVGQILDVSQLEIGAGGLLPVGFFTRRGVGVARAGGVPHRRPRA